MKRNQLAIALLFGASFFWACGNKDNKSTADNVSGDTATATTTNAAAAGTLSEEGKQFAMEAASGGMMEVQLGNLAMQNASSQRVKDFASMMIRDHGQANDQLKSLASAKNVVLPDSLMPKHRDHVQELQNVKGKEFDKKYMDMMVKDHEEDVSKFESAANTVTDADLKNFINNTLPVLRKHLDSARAINGNLK